MQKIKMSPLNLNSHENKTDSEDDYTSDLEKFLSDDEIKQYYSTDEKTTTTESDTDNINQASLGKLSPDTINIQYYDNNSDNSKPIVLQKDDNLKKDIKKATPFNGSSFLMTTLSILKRNSLTDPHSITFIQNLINHVKSDSYKNETNPQYLFYAAEKASPNNDPLEPYFNLYNICTITTKYARLFPTHGSYAALGQKVCDAGDSMIEEIGSYPDNNYNIFNFH